MCIYIHSRTPTGATFAYTHHFPWRAASVSSEKQSPATPMHGPQMVAAREEVVTGCPVRRPGKKWEHEMKSYIQYLD